MSVDLQVLKFREATEMERILSASLKDHLDELVQLGSPLIDQLSELIASIANKYQIPAISRFGRFPRTAA